MVEAYFWPLAMSYEPNYSIARRLVGKLIACISLLDDTYDAYATIEELELFTRAIQRLISILSCHSHSPSPVIFFSFNSFWPYLCFCLNFRWDISLIQSLPECMKVVFNTIVGLWDEIEMSLVESGKSYLVVEYIKPAVGFLFLY